MITIEGATNESDVLKLLIACKLPTEDVDLNSQQFWIAKSDGEIAGCIGLERAGNYGLLRSLAVDSNFRNRGIARILINHLIENAQGIVDLYLLTKTVDQYFIRHGFVREAREVAPKEIQQTKQFLMLCPSSAILMKKTL
jgi:amino-acid N-acetyltransferase